MSKFGILFLLVLWSRVGFTQEKNIAPDEELARFAQEQHLNVFIDTTDEPQENSTEDPLKMEVTPNRNSQLSAASYYVLKYATTHKLSLHQRRPDTILMWSKFDVIALAKRLVSTESIQLLDSKELEPDSRTIYTSTFLPPVVRKVLNQSDATAQNASGSKVAGSINAQETGSELPLPAGEKQLIEVAQNLSTQPPQEELINGRWKLHIWQKPLSTLHLSDQNLILGRAQRLTLQTVNRGSYAYWLNDGYWKDVRLVITQANGPAIRTIGPIGAAAPNPASASILSIGKIAEKSKGQYAQSTLGIAVIDALLPQK